MNPQDLTHAVSKTGPITRIMNGRGVRPWLPQVIVEPGWVYHVTELPTMYRPEGVPVRCCWKCVTVQLHEMEGHAMVGFEEEPPAPDARCAQCGRPFGGEP